MVGAGLFTTTTQTTNMAKRIKPKKSEEPKLKYELVRVGCMVCFRILYQDPRAYGFEWSPKCKDKKRLLNVNSGSGPGLGSEAIYLRGRVKDEDNRTIGAKLGSDQEACEYVISVHATLAAWAKEWAGFKTAKVKVNKEAIPSNTVYTV